MGRCTPRIHSRSEVDGFSFNLGVDMRSGGARQLIEAIEMIKRVNENVRTTQRVQIVINDAPAFERLSLTKCLGRMEHMEFALMQKVDHICKPDMR